MIHVNYFVYVVPDPCLPNPCDINADCTRRGTMSKKNYSFPVVLRRETGKEGAGGTGLRLLGFGVKG